MKHLSPYIDLLSLLSWKSIESEEMLVVARSCRKRADLLALIGSVTGTEPAELTLKLVRDLDYLARQQVRFHHDAAAEKLWVLARLVEYLLSLNQRPICKSCYRSVGLRSNGRLKDFCPHHASGKDSGRTAEYQRGRKHQHDMERLLSLLPSAEEFAQALLAYQLNSLRLMGGAAGRIVSKFDFNRFIGGNLFKIPAVQSISDEEWTALMEGDGEELRQLNEAAGGELRWRFSKAELMLDEITQDFPDWTELAMRWRARLDDFEGVQKLKGCADGAVTPLLLMEQWLRWKAWKLLGDEAVPVRRGRPARIDADVAVKMRAEGRTAKEIGEFFDVNPKSVMVFFSRLEKKRNEEDGGGEG